MVLFHEVLDSFAIIANQTKLTIPKGSYTIEYSGKTVHSESVRTLSSARSSSPVIYETCTTFASSVSLGTLSCNIEVKIGR